MNKQSNYSVAVAGATGAVGVEMVQVLEQRNFPVGKLKLLASSRSVGKTMKFRGADIAVEELRQDSFKGVDIALFSAGASISREFRKSVVDAGAVMIDNSSAFRMEADVPLVVPEVNPEDVAKHHGVIANPNCSTIIMLVAVAPLHRAFGLKRLVASTYQATSGAGAKGMDEMIVQTRQVLDGEPIAPSVFAHRIAFNLIPHIDVFMEDGFTKEEWKMMAETKKILDPKIKLTATCVRVPVFIGHSESVNIECEKPVTAEEAREILRTAPGILVIDKHEPGGYITPHEAAGEDATYISRIREDNTVENGLAFWCVSDNLRKGAALNAIQIAEVLVNRKLIQPRKQAA